MDAGKRYDTVTRFPISPRPGRWIAAPQGACIQNSHGNIRIARARKSCNDTVVPDTLTRLQKLFILVGSLGPLGHMPASGTVTVAVVGLPLFWLCDGVRWELFLAGTIAFAGVAVWLHHLGDRILGEKDSRTLVWDELAGFFVAVAFVPFTWKIAVIAFLLERCLDISKFPPAKWIEDHWPGGFGVVGDDLVAGAYTCAILHALMRFMPGWVGITP